MFRMFGFAFPSAPRFFAEILRLDPARSVAGETHSFEDRGSQIAILYTNRVFIFLVVPRRRDSARRDETQSAQEMTRGKRAEQYMVMRFYIRYQSIVWQCSRSRYGTLVYIDSSVISFADAIIPND